MNKRLIIVFVCIAIFVLVLVMGAVIFTINDVDILLSSNDNVAFDKTQILNTSGIKQGQSVFTINEKQASEKIEKQFPKLKVVKIERAFPNKVRVHLDVRKPILKMKVKNTDTYIVLDRELKIIDKTNDNTDKYLDKTITLISGLDFDANNSKDCLGDFLQTDDQNISALKKVIAEMEKFQVVNERFCATFDKIFVDKAKSITLKSVLGISIVVRTNTTVDVAKQTDLLFNKFYGMSGDERENKAFIYVNNNGSLVVSPTIDFNF